MSQTNQANADQQTKLQECRYTISLYRGASVSGWANVENGKVILPADAEAEIERLGHPPVKGAVIYLGGRKLGLKTQQDGWFVGEDLGAEEIEYTTVARTDWDRYDTPSKVRFTVDMELAQEIVKLQAIVNVNGLYKVEKSECGAEFLDDDDAPVRMVAGTLNVSADDFWFAGYIKDTPVEMRSERKGITEMAKEFGIEI